MNFSSPVFPVPASEIEKLRKDSALNILWTNARLIEDWSDYSFTADGRTFALFLSGDSIGHRLAARHILGMENPRERRHELNEIAGFIIEISTGEPPLIFKDHGELVKAWVGFHQMFGVPPSSDECDALDIESD